MWYQGCSDISGGNIGTEGKTYSDFFVALETVYRRVFGNDDELPFYVMQLAPYVADIENLSGFKAEQYDFCNELDNTYLVSLTNEGARLLCHCAHKRSFILPAFCSEAGFFANDLANKPLREYNEAIIAAMVLPSTILGFEVNGYGKQKHESLAVSAAGVGVSGCVHGLPSDRCVCLLLRRGL